MSARIRFAKAFNLTSSELDVRERGWASGGVDIVDDDGKCTKGRLTEPDLERRQNFLDVGAQKNAPSTIFMLIDHDGERSQESQDDCLGVRQGELLSKRRVEGTPWKRFRCNFKATV